mmetsp:Transcript_611/g.2358  ORF Transcript_611/g.2358 Transcript_611/m.2358 type:complete len:341 (+) Transcript_611:40-1062(+)
MASRRSALLRRRSREKPIVSCFFANSRARILSSTLSSTPPASSLLELVGDGLAHDLRGRDPQEVPPLPRHASLDDDAVLLHAHDLQLPRGHRLVTHLRVHLLTGEDAAGRGAGADGTVLPVRLGAVRHQTAREAVLLHGALPALTDGRAADVHDVVNLEDVAGVELRAELVRGRAHEAELLEVAHGGNASLGAVANLGLGDLVISNLVVPNLHGVVAVGVLGLDLSHDVARLDRDDGHGHAEALLREELRHASLVPENPHTRVVPGLDLEATGRRGAHGARGRGDAGAHERGRGRRRLQGLRGGRRRAHAGGKLDRGDSSHLYVSSARGKSVSSTGLSAN